MKIETNILEILQKCEIKVNTVYLPVGQLDRKTYLGVNKHLENLGGKWNRKTKGHVFDSDPTDSFENMLLTGETTDFKKEFQFFETPPELARKMIEMLEIEEDNNILEPSAGRGAIIDCFPILPKGSLLHAIEINPENYEILIEKGTCCAIKGDFLKVDLTDCESWDRIIMNPPFTKQQDVDHIWHAWSILKHGGMLVSVVSESPFFRDNRKSSNFRQLLLDTNAEVIINPDGTFKSSGTMVRTRLIKIIK